MQISNYRVAVRGGLAASPLLIHFIHNNVVITVENMTTLNRVLFLTTIVFPVHILIQKHPPEFAVLYSKFVFEYIFIQYLIGAPFA